MRTRENIALALIAAVAAACSGAGSEADVGGHTNWLECRSLADCDHPDVAACERGYCVNAAGQRIAKRSSAADAGPLGNDASAGGAAGSPKGAGAGGGGVDSGSGDSGASDASGGGAGGTGGTDAGGGEGGGAPDAGAATCDSAGALCCDPFPGDGPNYCNAGLQCCSDTCEVSCATGGGEIVVPDCPGTTTNRCASEACTAGGACVECPQGQVCVQVDLSCGPAGGSSAQCIDDPCAGATLDCACAAFVCEELDAATFTCGVFGQDHFLVGPSRNPFMACSGGGVCASPDTLIATPSGEVRIADLHRGDLVYSQEHDSIVVVPLLAVARTPVHQHRVVRLRLEDGRVLEVSGPHPTADGRRLDTLAVGEQLDGQEVVAAGIIPYAHPFTHDILPASSSGTYLANGVWLGSTLAGTSASLGTQ